MSFYTVTASTPITNTVISTTTTTTTTAAVTVTATTTATPTTTTAPAVAVSPEAAPGWIEFCERHARASASDFAKAFCTYVSLNLPERARSNLSHRDFLRKFVESFCEHFETEYLRRTVRSAVIFTKYISFIIYNLLFYSIEISYMVLNRFQWFSEKYYSLQQKLNRYIPKYKIIAN